MACDQSLAQRLRELLADEHDVTEKKMFGGLARCASSMTVSSVGRTSNEEFLSTEVIT